MTLDQTHAQDKEMVTASPDHFTPSTQRNNSLLWQVHMSPRPNGLKCSLKILQGGQKRTLNILYGDIWICAGSSNTLQPLKNVAGFQQIMKEAPSYKNIRSTKIPDALAYEEKEDYDKLFSSMLWADLSWKRKRPGALGQLSALCYLFAKKLADILGRDHVIATVTTGHGAAAIESFMPEEAFDQCEHDQKGSRSGPMDNSLAWNAMIAPLAARQPIRGAILYVGDMDNDERSKNPNILLNRFDCNLKALVSSWRQRWSLLAPDPLSFGLIQYHPMRFYEGVAEIRWKQTLGHGLVPNEDLPNTFMAVALDMRDNYTDRAMHYRGGLHPRHKLVVAQRLSYGAASVAYRLGQFRTNGPFPKSIEREGLLVNVTYGEEFLHDDTETSGFYICCNTPFQECQSRNKQRNWRRLSQSRTCVQPHLGLIRLNLTGECHPKHVPTGLAFLYEGVPIERYLGDPIYSMDEFHLPAAPWRINFRTLKWKT